jgi:protein-S-isoprenylcysteine O-methyltransferase Ste14
MERLAEEVFRNFTGKDTLTPEAGKQDRSALAVLTGSGFRVMDLKKQFKEIDFERVILVSVFILLMLANASNTYQHLMEHSFSDLTSTLHVLYKGLIICFYFLMAALFLVQSRARATTSSLLARTVAYGGTFAPFLWVFTKNPESGVPLTLLSLSIMTSAMLFACYTLRTLGRSFSIMPQARTLVRSGPYRLIRHPLYVGELGAFGGAVLSVLTIENLGSFVSFR